MFLILKIYHCPKIHILDFVCTTSSINGNTKSAKLVCGKEVLVFKMKWYDKEIKMKLVDI